MFVFIFHGKQYQEALDHMFLMLIPLHYLATIRFLKQKLISSRTSIHHDGNRPDRTYLLSESFVLEIGIIAFPFRCRIMQPSALIEV